jgi:hypothetical protein
MAADSRSGVVALLDLDTMFAELLQEPPAVRVRQWKVSTRQLGSGPEARLESA